MNVYYTPSIQELLILLGWLQKKGLVFMNKEMDYGILMNERMGEDVIEVRVQDQVYPIVTWKPNGPASAQSPKVRVTLMEAHWRLAHVSVNMIIHVMKGGHFMGLDVGISMPVEQCEVCLKLNMLWKEISKVNKPHNLKNLGKCMATCGDQLKTLPREASMALYS